MKPILISSGEPAGVGPDICLALAATTLPVVVLGDKAVLAERAGQLALSIKFHEYHPQKKVATQAHHLSILSTLCPSPVEPGVLNTQNASYVLNLLTQGVERCLKGEFSALVTAPVNKAIINQAGFSFTGHTEFFAEKCQVKTVVMMLACKAMKVALVTTHLPLREVADAITRPLLTDVITCLHQSLQRNFGIIHPKIAVAGLNPHAGESGHLGREELDMIIPCLDMLRKKGILVTGPLPADTLFNPANLEDHDVFLAMYHDQGLPVLKYAGFGDAVNVTLGLPIIRTSVDHGTALTLAGSGLAKSTSLLAAVDMAIKMAKARNEYH